MMKQKDRCQKRRSVHAICSGFGLVAYSSVRKNEYSTVPKSNLKWYHYLLFWSFCWTKSNDWNTSQKKNQNWYPNPNRLATFS